MSLEFETFLAEDYCLRVADGTHDSPKEVEFGKKLVTSKNIIGGKLDLEKSYFISLEDFNEVNKRSKVDQWDILISMIGTVGEVALIKEKPDFAIKNVGLLKNNDEYAAKWLYYYLKSDLGQYQIKSRLRGTTQLYIPLKDLRKLEIEVPKNREELIKIVKILDNIDLKIENCLMINHNLEKISSRLYSNLIYDKKDLEFIELKEICKFIKGRKPTEISEQYKSDFEDYLTIEVLSNQNQTYAFDEKGIKAEEMDILMVMDGASSGKLFYGKKGLVGSTLAKIDVKENYIELVYQFLKINEKYITENTTGSAIPHTDKGLVLSLRLPISEKLTEYSDKFKNIRLAIISNNNEIMKLQHLRDILLPKLMSGEIDVSKINCDLKLIIRKFIFKIISYLEDLI